MFYGRVESKSDAKQDFISEDLQCDVRITDSTTFLYPVCLDMS